MRVRDRLGQCWSKIKTRRVPWHVTLFALCIWSFLLGAWPVSIISCVCGIGYLFWPRIEASIRSRRRRDSSK